MGMAKRYFVETTPGGRQQVVSVKRSRSYGGHQNRVREFDYIKVSLDEWNGLVEKERRLQQVNRTVVDETNAVRSALLSAQADNKRLTAVVVPGLDKQIASLTVENESLRRACAGAGDAPPAPLPSAIKKTYREEEKLRARVARLEEQAVELRSENVALQERNRSLQRKVDAEAESPERRADLVTDAEYWKGLSRSWRSRYLGLRKRYDELYDLLDTRSKKVRAYEDILERNGMV
ncbi:hypothetical protein ESCO_001736 [Escovopsis weberi]|uniref:Uncharacterized protein n=1 Tax=Escovopsis weberi TaxID=150374 RepID=A0A0M8MYS1_ESCWE|nr:hypothetical protein ESCO_001736 [Escovopsis weberi]